MARSRNPATPRLARASLLTRSAIGGMALLAAPAAALLPGQNIYVNDGGTLPDISVDAATSTTDVVLHADRTVIQYNGFTVASGETYNMHFDANDWIGIIHNVGQEAITIDGRLQGFVGAGFGGNIWLLSANGVLFGANARVDVGGLLASTSVPADLTSQSGQALTPTTLSFDFGNGSGLVSVAEGAQITGHGGTLAFLAPSVRTASGSTIGGSGNTAVLYGAAQRYTVRFVREAGNDLDLLDFEVPGLTAGSLDETPIALAGTTGAGNVYVASVGRADTVRAVLQAGGDIAATSAGLEGGTIVLTSGGGIASRAAAPLFGDGTQRQDVQAYGALTAARDLAVTAIGDIGVGSASAGGSVKLRGVGIQASELTAGQDIVAHGGDPIGSSGEGNGYGVYGPEGGNVSIYSAVAGDDVLVTTWNGGIDLTSIGLTGLGPDAAADPLDPIDAPLDGQRLLLRTTGDFGDVRIGSYGEGSFGTLAGGSDLRIESTGYVRVTVTGGARLTSVDAAGFAEFRTGDALDVGSVTANGYIFAGAGLSAAFGSATTKFDSDGNGQIVLRGGTGVRLNSGDAASDIILASDDGDAIGGSLIAGDDIIVDAARGNVSVTSLTLDASRPNNDRDGNLVETGQFGFPLLFDLSLDTADNGRVATLHASEFGRFGEQLPSGGDVLLGQGTGGIGADGELDLRADRDVLVSLSGGFTLAVVSASRDVSIDGDAGVQVGNLFAGRDAVVRSSGGDAALVSGYANGDVSILAAGLASADDVAVGQDFILSGATVALGELRGTESGGPRDITIRATAGDFSRPQGLYAGRDLTLDIAGTVGASSLGAGDDLRITAATIGIDYGSTGEGGDSEGDGHNIVLSGGSIGAVYLSAEDDIIATGSGAGVFGPAACQFGCEGSGIYAGRDLSLTGASLTFDTSLEGGRDLSLTTTVAALDIGQALDAGRDLRLTSAAALTSASPLSAGQDLVLDGASVNVGTVAALRDAAVTARTGDALVAAASVKQDLRLTAAQGLASLGDGKIGRDLSITGAQAALGGLGPYTEPAQGYGQPLVLPTRDVTVVTTAGDFAFEARLDAARDVRLTIAGKLDLATVRAGQDVLLGATGGLTLSDAQGASSAGRDALFDGRGVTLAGFAAGRDLTATAGASTLLSIGALQAGDDLRLTGLSITAAGLNVVTAQDDTEGDGRTITLDGGSAALDSATAPDTIRATLSGALTTGSASVAATSITINAGSIGRSVADTSEAFGAQAGLTLVASGGIDTGGLRSDSGTVTVDAGTDLHLRGGVNGQRAILGGGTVALDLPVNTAALTRVTARSGALGADVLNSDGDVIVSATGPLGIVSVRAGDDATLDATGTLAVSGPVVAGLTGQNVPGTDSEDDGYNIRVNGGGAVTLASLAAPADIIVDGGSVQISALDARRDARISANAGDARVGSASVKRDLSVLAANGLAQLGIATAGQDVHLSGQTAALGSLGSYTEPAQGYGQPLVLPTRDLFVTTTGGGFSLTSPLALARDAGFSIAGSLFLGPVTTGRDFNASAAAASLVSVRAGDDIRLGGGTVSAASLVSTGLGPDSDADGSNIVILGSDVGVRNGNAAQDFSIDATGTIALALGEGGIDAGRDIFVRGAVLTAERLTATRDLRLMVAVGDLSLSLDQSGGRDVVLDASGAVSGLQAAAGRDLNIAGGSVDFGALSAGRDLSGFARSGDFAAASAQAGDDARFSGAAVTLNYVETSGAAADTEGDGSNIAATGGDVRFDTATALGDVAVLATGIATLGLGEGGISAGRDIIASGGTLGLGGLDAGRDLLLTATASGIASTTGLSAVRDLQLDSALGIAVADVSAGRDLLLTGNGVSGGAGTAGRDATVNSGAGLLSFTSLSAGDDVRLGGANIDVETALASGLGGDSEDDGANIFANGGTITLEIAFAAKDIIVKAGEVAALGIGADGSTTGSDDIYQAYAGGDVIVSAASILAGPLTAGRDVLLTATSGGIDARGSIVAGRDIGGNAATTLNFAALSAGDDIRLSAPGDAVLATVQAFGDSPDSEGDGRNIVIDGAAVTLASVTAATDVRIIATGVLTTTATHGLAIDAGRDARLSGTALALGGIGAGRDLALTASASGIAVGGLSAARDLTLDASGVLSFDSASAGRDLGLAGASIEGGTATAANNVLAIARNGAISIASIDAGNDAYAAATGGDAAAGNARVRGNLSILAAQGLAQVGSARVGGDLLVSGASAALASLDGYTSQGNGYGGNFTLTRSVTLTATAGNIGGGAALTVAKDVIATASGSAMLGDLDAGNDIVAVAGGGLELLTASAGHEVRLSGGGVNSGALDAGGDVTIDSTAAISVGGVTAGDDVRLTATASGLSAGDIDAVRDLILDASGGLTAGHLSAGRDLTLAGASITGGNAAAGADLSATARSGALSLAALTAGDDVRLTSGGALSARAITATASLTDSEADGANIAVSGGGAVELGNLAAGRDVIASGGTLALAGISAGRDVTLATTAGDFSSTADLGAVRDLSIDASGALTLTGPSAGRDLTLRSGGILTASTATAGDDVRLTGGAITVTRLAAITDISVTGSGAVSIGRAAAGGDVLVSGATIGGSLQLSGRDIAVTSGGAFAAAAGLVAARDLRLTAGTTLSFARLDAARDLVLTAATVQGGSTTAARDLTVNATLRIAGVRFEAGRTLILDPNEIIDADVVRSGGDATLIGASIRIGLLQVGGLTFAQATAGGIALDTFTGGAATLLATGRVDLGDSATAALRIVGGDLDVRRSLIASSLQVETPGRMILGGVMAAQETGFRLAAVDISRLRVKGAASFYAGVTTLALGQGGGDLVVQDFAYDPANLPALALYADRSHVIDVQGRVAPSVTGGSIVIGDSASTGRFRPESIFISGSFGAAELVENCYGKIVAVGALSLYAVNDVIFGASDFRAAIRAADPASIDLVAGSPAVPAGPGDNRLFAVATRFTVDAAGKIVSQNTAASDGAYAGLFFNGSGASGPIVSIGNARAIDLAGSLVDSAGNLRSGPTVAFAGELGSGVKGAVFRFNGCIVGGSNCLGGGGATSAEVLRIEDYEPPRPIDILDEPLTTVLIVDQQPNDLEVLTIGSDGDAIVIRRRRQP